MVQPVILATGRSPIGRAYKGSFVDTRADDLLRDVVRAVLASVPEIEPAGIDDMYVGAWEQSGEQGENIARRVAVDLGYDHLPGASVNRGCGSSLEAIRMAANAVAAGDLDLVLCGGVESVSRYPDSVSEYGTQRNPRFAAAGERTDRFAAGGWRWDDPRASGDLPDVYIAMGQTAENVAERYGVTREDQDQWAFTSQSRAAAAIERGFFTNEIIPITRPDGIVVDRDDSPRPGTTLDGLAELKPVFRPDGTVTAGNACPLNDGAAAVIVTSDLVANQLGVAPLARIVSFGVSGLSPEIMGVGPVDAVNRALRKVGMAMGDVDIVELNEAFAAQVVASARELGVDQSRLNPNGGSIALGHPYGMTGARIATTLVNGLKDADATVGVETMCIGGGQGLAMVIERID